MLEFPKPAFESIQLAELCKRLDIPYRHARYVLEEGIVPRGVDPSPDRGNHRQLTPSQAFWLGIVLNLKESGVRSTLAAQIADFANEAMRGMTQRMNWDPHFSPFDGRLDSEYEWYIDIGDLTFIRVVTTAGERVGEVTELPWWRLGGERQDVKGVDPIVTIRLNITQLAALLRG
jgi:hypothetical protein